MASSKVSVRVHASSGVFSVGIKTAELTQGWTSRHPQKFCHILGLCREERGVCVCVSICPSKCPFRRWSGDWSQSGDMGNLAQVFWKNVCAFNRWATCMTACMRMEFMQCLQKSVEDAGFPATRYRWLWNHHVGAGNQRGPSPRVTSAFNPELSLQPPFLSIL